MPNHFQNGKSSGRLDHYFPPRGPCAFCGGPDARHRLWDALYDRWRGGEEVEALALDYQIQSRAIVAVLVEFEQARRRHRRRPGR